MDALPQVGQKYQHKKWGDAEVYHVSKLGRGYSIEFVVVDGFNGTPVRERLADFRKSAQLLEVD